METAYEEQVLENLHFRLSKNLFWLKAMHADFQNSKSNKYHQITSNRKHFVLKFSNRTFFEI